MSNILVTGGAGFLGINLCHQLLNDGHHVTCVDNFYSCDPSHVHDLTSHPHFTLIEHDIRHPLSLPPTPLDQIYHLACPASPPLYQKDPIFTSETCFVGTLHMLRLAHEHQAVMVQASTSEVYGDPQEHPQTEEYRGHVNPCGVRACYDEGKRVAESLCFDFKRRHQLDVRVARIFNSYGPFMDQKDGRVISNFLNQAIGGKPLTVYGDGSQTRSFCYVDDMIAGLVALMNHPKPLDGAVNLGNQDEFSIMQLAELVLSMTKSNGGITYEPLPQDDPMQRCPDISRAKKWLAWQPTITLNDGLQRTKSYFEQELL